MSDLDISNLHTSAFTDCTIVTGLVVQRTRNFQTRRGEQIIPRLAPIPVNHSHLPDNSRNASRTLASIFLANTSRKSINNALAPTHASRDSLHRVMGIKDDDNSDNQLSDLDDDNESNFVYHNLEDEAKFDQKTAADNEENEIKIESESHSDLEIEAIVAQPAGRRQVRSNIHTQNSVILIDGCKYFKCNTCPQ